LKLKNQEKVPDSSFLVMKRLFKKHKWSKVLVLMNWIIATILILHNYLKKYVNKSWAV